MHSGFRERGRGSLDGQSETTFTTMADSEAEVENQGTVKNSQDAARRKPQSTACVPLGGGEEATTSSFSAHLAENCLEWDLSIALVLPLLMIMSVAKSVDPRVGPEPGGSPRCNLAFWAALPDFPCGASTAKQVLHIVRHLPSYALLLPLRLGDWPGAIINMQVLAFPVLFVLLAFSPRTSRLWAFWRRWRLATITTADLASRCVLLVPSFLLLPPRTWPTLSWSRYAVSASTSPLLNAILLGVLDQAFKVTFGPTVLLALVQTAAAFFLAYRVTPSILALQMGDHHQHEEQQQPDQLPVPVQCGELRPEHAALLSCWPLALQVLLGLAMVAWPVWLSWVVDRRLRRQHAALCRERERTRWQQGKLQAPVAGAQPQQPGTPPCSAAATVATHPQGGVDVTFGVTDGHPGTTATASVPAAAAQRCAARLAQLPSSTGRTPRPSALYRSSLYSAVVSLKVQEHPRTFEEDGALVASALYDTVQQHLAAAARRSSDAARDGGAPQWHLAEPAGPLLMSTVIRGCIQVVLWGLVPEGEALGAAAAGGLGGAALAEQLLQLLAPRLDQAMAQEGTRGVRGVSMQVGQGMGLLRAPGGAQLPGAVGQEQQQEDGTRGSRSISSPAPIGLLQLTPPAVPVPASAASSGPVAVRLLLHSPTPQSARVLVLAERQGTASSSSAEPSAQPLGDGLAPRSPVPARLLLELPVQLMGGVQEVQLALGAGELAGAVGADGAEGVAAGEPGAGACVLRVMMVGPEHAGASVGGQREGAASATALVHWVAPPLLLLPSAAAAEVCDAWEAIQSEAGGGLADEADELEGTGQEQEQQSGEETQAYAGGLQPHTGVSAAARSNEVSARAERRSFLWWYHMGPLLEDLALVLRGQQRQEDDMGVAQYAWQALLPYLQGHGMTHTLSMLAACGQDQHHQQQQQGLSRSTSPACSPTAACVGAATSDQTPAATHGGGHLHRSHGASQPPACAAAGAAAPAVHRPFLLLLPQPFAPAPLEADYQAWRLARLVRSNACVLGFCAIVTLAMWMRTVMSCIMHAGGGGGGGGGTAGAAPWAHLAHATCISVLNTVSHGLAPAVLQARVIIRSRAAQRQRQQHASRELGKGQPSSSALGLCALGLGAEARSAVLQPGDMLAFRLAACVAGPTVLLVCNVLVLCGLTPLDNQLVRNSNAVYAVSLIRAVAMPCMQQLSAWEAAAAAPLMGVADALLVLAMQPGWGLWCAAAVAVVWRLGAVVVSAVWEVRSRRRYVRMHQGAAAAEGFRTGGGSFGSKVKEA